MSLRSIIIITLGLLLFLAISKPINAQESQNTSHLENRQTPATDYYYTRKLDYQETEGLLTASGWLILAGFVIIEPEALMTFVLAGKKIYSTLNREEIFRLFDQLL